MRGSGGVIAQRGPGRIPATPCCQPGSRSAGAARNEGLAEPRQRLRFHQSGTRRRARQRGPGWNPGNVRDAGPAARVVFERATRAGAEPRQRRHRILRRPRREPTRTRAGAEPGNAARMPQTGPGSGSARKEGRGRAPATPAAVDDLGGFWLVAQRGPGPNPGNACQKRGAVDRHRRGSRNEGRGRTPATPPARMSVSSPGSPRNEGRGWTPATSPVERVTARNEGRVGPRQRQAVVPNRCSSRNPSAQREQGPNPATPSSCATWNIMPYFAQRRPGRIPATQGSRRTESVALGAHNGGRSGTPATTLLETGWSSQGHEAAQ